LFRYADLGIHWASSIPAFLALACVPFPFLFYKYGAAIRAKGKYAAESAAFMRRMQQLHGQAAAAPAPAPQEEVEIVMDKDADRLNTAGGRSEGDGESDAGSDSETNPTYAPIAAQTSRRISRTMSRASSVGTRSLYEGNPYDIDRVNTRNSFVGPHR
jgi:hypothetical protein